VELQQTFTVAVPSVAAAREQHNADSFWDAFTTICAQEDRASPLVSREQREHVTLARIAALMQILAPEAPDMKVGLVKYLAGVTHPESSRALARLAIFSAEEEVRHAAVDALKVRRERDYTAVLLAGLRYPWPAVARRAADALVKLERADLVPQLIDVLDEADPRAPAAREVEGRKVSEVKELVRVNHHRNCLLCHAPGNTNGVGAEALTAAVPVPNEPLPSPSQGYQNSSPDVLVRLDVTYLRQDFSAFQPVADANPWPEMQRFDFLVRSRTLSEEEAAAYREKLERREPGRFSPYQRAALAALRELTGKDTEPSADAWRRLLDLPRERRGVVR
jgi:mono/diheme cytochrome c family protein